MYGAVVRGRKSHKRLCADRIKSRLIAHGLYETMNYSFISKKAFDMLDLPEDDSRRQTVSLLNPLGEEYSVMRTQLISSMLNVISLNLNRKIPGARLFELNKVFLPKSDNADDLPDEVLKLSIGLYGEEEDFFTLKGIVEDVLSLFGVVPGFKASKEPFLHPGRQAQALYNDEIFAVMGEVHPDTAERFGINTRVYVAQISVEALAGIKQPLVLYRPLPRFPAIERDLALVCDRNLAVAEIESTIKNFAGHNLESIALFDVYQGEQIEKGKKSVAYRLTFRSAQSTLKDEDVDAALNKIIIKLKDKGCILRS
jgi:phenylalanyl-tRNA synthetase beta chain